MSDNTIPQINIATSTFLQMFNSLIATINAIATEVVTVNTNANGAINQGNGFVTGIFGGDTIVVGTALRGGNVQTSNALNITSNVVLLGGGLNWGNVNFATTTPNQNVDQFVVNTYRTAKYVLQAANLTNYQATELLVTHNGSSTFLTEYAQMPTGSLLGTFSANVVSGNVVLMYTPVNAGTLVTFKRETLTA